MEHTETAQSAAELLAGLYEQGFAGKERGRYRISMKHMRMLTGRRRVSPDLIRSIREELFEAGYVLVDMETFFVILSPRTFGSYRRVNDACLNDLLNNGSSGQ